MREATATARVEGPRTKGMDDIAAEVAHVFDVKPQDLFSQNRDKRTARARHVAMYLCRKLPGPPSYPEIGRVFGRDHTSVITAVRVLEELRGEDPNLNHQLHTLEARLGDRVDAVYEMAVFYDRDDGAADFTVHEMRARQGIGPMLRAGR